jgi:hypothetical protein
MIKSILLFFFVLLMNITFVDFSYGQNKVGHKIYRQNHLDKNRVCENIYNFYWYKNRWMPKADTIAYFVDDRNYKGVINYGVEFRSKDFRRFNYIEII